jgi:hypothetical protein
LEAAEIKAKEFETEPKVQSQAAGFRAQALGASMGLAGQTWIMAEEEGFARPQPTDST